MEGGRGLLGGGKEFVSEGKVFLDFREGIEVNVFRGGKRVFFIIR